MIDRSLTHEEIESLLQKERHGVLAYIDAAGKPAVRPMAHMFQGDEILFVSGPGHKADDLMKNPSSAFTVFHAGKEEWKSAIARGTCTLKKWFEEKELFDSVLEHCFQIDDEGVERQFTPLQDNDPNMYIIRMKIEELSGIAGKRGGGALSY